MEYRDDRVFIYLRLRVGSRELARSKIREFGGLGSLLVDFLRQATHQGIELPEDMDPDDAQVPVLDYVDANGRRPLISFSVDPVQQEQVIEGCIPPAYQARMLDPDATSFSVTRFLERAGDDIGEDDRRELTERLARSQLDLLARIRETMDEEGNFAVRVPLGR